MQNKKKRNLLYYQYVEHWNEILSHDRGYSNVDVHEKAVLSPKTEERSIEKHENNKKKTKCLTLIYKTG